VSRFDILDQHYRSHEAAALFEYQEARAYLELENYRGVLSPEEYRELSRSVEDIENAYYEAQVGAALFAFSGLRQEAAAHHLARIVERISKACRASESLARLRMATHRLFTEALEPPAFRLAYSLPIHGPPRVLASRHGAALGIT
jgi:hypothetical protein